MPLSADNTHHIEQYAKLQVTHLETATETKAFYSFLIRGMQEHKWSSFPATPEEKTEIPECVQALNDPKTTVRVIGLEDSDVDEARYIFVQAAHAAFIEKTSDDDTALTKEQIEILRIELEKRFAELPKVGLLKSEAI